MNGQGAVSRVVRAAIPGNAAAVAVERGAFTPAERDALQQLGKRIVGDPPGINSGWNYPESFFGYLDGIDGGVEKAIASMRAHGHDKAEAQLIDNVFEGFDYFRINDFLNPAWGFPVSKLPPGIQEAVVKGQALKREALTLRTSVLPRVVHTDPYATYYLGGGVTKTGYRFEGQSHLLAGRAQLGEKGSLADETTIHDFLTKAHSEIGDMRAQVRSALAQEGLLP